MQYPPNNQPNTYYPPQQWQQPQYPPPPPPIPPKKQNPWLAIAIIIFVVIAIGAIGSSITKKSTNQQTTINATPTDTPIPTETPAETPEPQAVYNWHGKGTQKTNEFSMQGTWHVKWYCLGSSWDLTEDASQYLTINLYNADTGKILQTWQHACVTNQFDETVKYSGNFLIEGITTKQTIEYHISVLQ